MRVIKREPRQRGARGSVNYYGVGYEQTRGIDGNQALSRAQRLEFGNLITGQNDLN
jgi:hypothetical protein